MAIAGRGRQAVCVSMWPWIKIKMASGPCPPTLRKWPCKWAGTTTQRSYGTRGIYRKRLPGAAGSPPAAPPHVIAPVETIIVLYKDEWKRKRPGENDITGEEFKDWVGGCWSFNGESAKRIGHEAPFPRELPRRCIKLFSFVGDVVLDPFMGSGTTLAKKFKRL